jgi:hypothetical protein
MSTLGDFANNRRGAIPTPWRIGDAGHTVFGPKTDAPAPKIIASNLSRENAQLIVRAVNAHADLTAALQWMIDETEHIVETDTDLDRALANARALLARVHWEG